MSEASSRGYPVYFVDQPPTEVPTECPICLNVIFSPMTVTCCGHSFCSACITSREKAGKLCPLCRHPFTSMPDGRLERIINGFEVYCPNRDKGCTWRGQLGQCDHHLGKYKSFCQFEERFGGRCHTLKPATSSEAIQLCSRTPRGYVKQYEPWDEEKPLRSLDKRCESSITLIFLLLLLLLLIVPLPINIKITKIAMVITVGMKNIFDITASSKDGIILQSVHQRPITRGLTSDFDLEVYKSPVVNTMSSQCHASTIERFEIDIGTTKGTDSCSYCMCACEECDYQQELQTDSTKDQQMFCIVNYNIIIHGILAILLMIALLWIGNLYQHHLQNTEITTNRYLSASAFILYTERNEHLFVSGVHSITRYFLAANNMASVPFIGEVEVITCDSRGCEYWNPDHDITVQIPPGTIPPGISVQIEVAVTLYGPFQFPNSSFPISPILWLCSQREIAFKKPIKIILPHIVNNSQMNFGIKFAKADHKWYSIDKSGTKCYVFEPVDTAFANVKEESRNYGLLSISHCCFFCITADSSFRSDVALGAGYCFWCIEKPLSPPQTRDKVLLCTTFFLNTCSTVSSHNSKS